MTTRTTLAVAAPIAHADKNGFLFSVMRQDEPLPAEFKLQASAAEHRVAIRVTGGCKFFTPALLDGLVPFFVDSARERDAAGKVTHEFRGVIMSGGTADRTDDGIYKQNMVTIIPGAYVEAGLPCVALSTTPRTGILAANRDGAGLMVGGSHIDLRQHGGLIVQESAAIHTGNWGYDLPIYLTFLADLASQGWKTGIESLNGGGITRDELYGALELGLPITAVRGSLRETDAFIAAVTKGDFTLTAVEDRANLEKKGLDAATIASRVDPIIDRCKAIIAAGNKDLLAVVDANDAASMRAVRKERGWLLPV